MPCPQYSERLLTGRKLAAPVFVISVAPQAGAVRAVVKAELLYGARKSRDVAANSRTLRRFFEPFRSFPFDDRCAETYGGLRAELGLGGTPIGHNDLQIAAIAIANDLVLVTHDERSFRRLVSLEIEDWEA